MQLHRPSTSFLVPVPWRGIAIGAAAVAALSSTWQLTHAGSAASPGTTPGPQRILAGKALGPRTFCSQPADGPFTPTSITITGITHDANVLALPRDARDIPSAAPLTEAGKHEFAWDRPPGIMPGSPRGNVLLNAHTWPWGSAPALGNLMLDHLRPGARIVVRGHDANGLTHQCYQVTRKVEIWADEPYPAYYSTDGAPQLAIMVCSGQRVGPGDWLKRMIWFASPVSV